VAEERDADGLGRLGGDGVAQMKMARMDLLSKMIKLSILPILP
jgi:hypothetical protein